MSLTRKYVTRPVAVEAVQVTEENMPQVAEWCGGTIEKKPYRGSDTKHIKVPVHRPQSPRQTMAFVGDWVLLRDNGHQSGFKVYLDRAFTMSYTDELGIPLASADDVAAVIFDEMIEAFNARKEANRPKKPVKLETGSHTVIFDNPAPAVVDEPEDQMQVLREDISATPQ